MNAMKLIKDYYSFLKGGIFEAKNDNTIEVGDYVTPIDFSDLTDKQERFLRSNKTFIVDDITSKGDTKFIDIGYNIPLKMNRFEKAENPFDNKVLFLQFDFRIDRHNEDDVDNYFKGYNTMGQLFPDLIHEKSPKTKVDFYNYSDVYKLKDGYYVKNTKLTDYNFVFFGFMAKYTNLATLLANYVVKNNIPHMKYETYDYLHNKAYQFDLLEDLGYPYIPSVMTTKLTKNLLNNIEEFGYPLIVKDVYLDQGKGVFKMNNIEELKEFFSNNDRLVLIQKFIPNDGEWRVITVKNKVQLIARKDSIEDVNQSNIDARKSKKGILPSEVTSMCEDISTHLFSDIVGFDIIQDLTDKKYYVIETNASPHFVMFSIVTNVSIPEKIVDYIIKNMK